MKKILVFLLIIGVGATAWFWWHDHDNEVERREHLIEPTVPATEPEVATDPEIIERTFEAHIVERFFYNQLDEAEQVIYRELRDGVYRGDLEIRLETDDAERVHEIYQLILFDYPEFFWITGAGMSTITRWSDGTAYITFQPEYAHTLEARATMQIEIDEAVEAFVSTINPGMSDYDVVLAVYEHIIFTTSYNLDASDHQNIYSVFVNQESVCAGFARAAQLLLNQLGVPTIYVAGVAYVPGTSVEPIAHAWNLVRLAGEYYHLDVTWGSPNFQNEGMANHPGIVYDYFLINDELIFRTHTITPGMSVPAATSLRHNFFVVNGMFYEDHDAERVLEAMNASVMTGEAWIAFQFATPALFDQMRPIILDDLAPQAARTLAEWYGLESVQYMIREKGNLNKITIYWVYE
ncbi:MAG: hypothetical protein FWE07_01665 [Turicibacter sp.]|nr:hypothetical protein [Turicibacter sp.]